MMKFKYFMLSSFAALQLTHAQDTKEVTIHNGLGTAIDQVDSDGEFLKLEKSGELLEKITKLADDYVLPELVKTKDLPENFSFVKVLELSGIEDITARSESVKIVGNNYTTKHFIQTNGSRKGILSLLGKSDKPWASLEFAPADTALLLETHLDLTAVPDIMKQLAPMLKERDAKKMLAGLNQQDPIAKKTLEQILQQVDARISIIATLDQSKTWGPSTPKLPTLNATGRIDGIANFLWENYGQMISGSLPVKSEGNVHTLIFPEPIQAPWGPLTPVVVVDTDNNHIWVSVSEEHLQLCKSGKTSITENTDFQLVNKGARDNGASRLYLSKQLIGIGSNILQEVLSTDLQEPTAKKALKEVVSYLQTFDSISSTTSHDNKGILTQINAPFPMRSDQVGNLQTVASLAGLSYGPIMKHQNSAKRTQDISKLKNIHFLLIGYLLKHDGKYPENLQQLVEEGFADEEDLIIEGRKITYIKGLDQQELNKVILYTTPDEYGKVIYATVNEAVNTISQHELEALLEKQQ